MEKEENHCLNSSDSLNRVANKFNMVVDCIKIIGYGSIVVILLISLLASFGNGFVMFLCGIVISLVIFISIFLSTLGLEAISEMLNLLQDIKNK